MSEYRLVYSFAFWIRKSGIPFSSVPDFRIQKANEYTKRYSDMYLCDNGMQLTTAMEDFEYTKWLDPDRVPCYVKDVAKQLTA